MRKKTKSKLIIYLIVIIAIIISVVAGASMGFIDLSRLGTTLSLNDNGVDTDGDGINDFEDNCPVGVNSDKARSLWNGGELRRGAVIHPTGSYPSGDRVDAVQFLPLGCEQADPDNDGQPSVTWRLGINTQIHRDHCPTEYGISTGGAQAICSSQWTGLAGTECITQGNFQLGNLRTVCGCVFAGCPLGSDTDRDGTPNIIDQCWLTSGQDVAGCPPPDTDRDGVNDLLDECPNTPEGLTVGVAGCRDGSELQCTAFEQVSCIFGNCECETLPDFDNDGIYDIHDSCVEEPETKNSYQDADGCPDVVPTHLLDTDGDEINDDIDQCVNEAETINSYQDTDGCPDELPLSLVDNDGDFVFDDVDQCPTQPETHNMWEDGDGCPDDTPLHLTDTDGDGIFDDTDQCENQRENINNFQDADGCPDELPFGSVTTTDDTVVVREVQFDDHDGDGILNVDDECATRVGTEMFSGCPDSATLIKSSTFEIPVSPTVATSPDTNQLTQPTQTTPTPQPLNDTIVEGIDDSMILIIVLFVLTVVVVAIVVGSGKAKL